MPKSILLKELALKHGTPLFIVDHDVIRNRYAAFRRFLPRVQAYYAVKANPDPAIIRTLYEIGASFDVASIAEFNLVYDHLKAFKRGPKHISAVFGPTCDALTPSPRPKSFRISNWETLYTARISVHTATLPQPVSMGFLRPASSILTNRIQDPRSKIKGFNCQ